MLRRIEGILSVVANATEGSRNSKVFWASKRFEEMIRFESIDSHQAENLLFNIAKMYRLDSKEISTAIRGLRS